VTAAALPEADEVEVVIDPKDIRIDTFCSSGPGGQSVTLRTRCENHSHPTGEVVSVRMKIADQEPGQSHARAAVQAVREGTRGAAEVNGGKSPQPGETGDRSEKRTYNFPQNRVTDHRIGLTAQSS
jgi:peptide chain release factor 1